MVTPQRIQDGQQFSCPSNERSLWQFEMGL